MCIGSFLCTLDIVKFEVTISKPSLVVSEVVTVLLMSGPGDHIIAGLGIPLAVQLSTTPSPAIASNNTLLFGAVMAGPPN